MCVCVCDPKAFAVRHFTSCTLCNLIQKGIKLIWCLFDVFSLQHKSRKMIHNTFTTFGLCSVGDSLGAITALGLFENAATSSEQLCFWCHRFFFPATLKLLQVGRQTLVHTAQPFSDLSRDVQLDSSVASGWATQRRSQSCPEDPPLVYWLGCVLRDCCPTERWNVTPV